MTCHHSGIVVVHHHHRRLLLLLLTHTVARLHDWLLLLLHTHAQLLLLLIHASAHLIHLHLVVSSIGSRRFLRATAATASRFKNEHADNDQTTATDAATTDTENNVSRPRRKSFIS